MLTVKCPNLSLVLVGFEEILSLFALITFSDYIVFVYQKKMLVKSCGCDAERRLYRTYTFLTGNLKF